MSGKRSSGERLAARRRSKRRRVLFTLGFLLLLFCGAAVYGLRQSAVRISDIQVFGADPSLSKIARAAIQGNYFGVIPRDSTFFFPAARIRTDIVTAYPDVAAVSIFRSGLTSLSIKVDNRVPIAQWCGSAGPLQATSSPLSAGCYFFDASGFIYATTSSAQPLNRFVVYESLMAPVGNSVSSSSPIGSTLPNADTLPAAFDFARQLATFGSPVVSIVFSADEVDDYLASGTRVTYVLGNEENAFTALTSARANFNLADGSVEYVDLRFGGKIYLKKK